VAGGEGAPAIVKDVRVWFCANVLRDEGVRWSAICGFAAGEEVWSRTADGVFDDVGCEGGENQAC